MSDPEISLKPKNPYLAAILGFLLGPLSSFYFGWEILIAVLIVFTISILLVSWFFPFPIPSWFIYVDNAFFAILNFFFALLFNEKLQSEGDLSSPIAVVLLGVSGWYIRFCSTFMGLYSAILLFKNGHWGKALLIIFLGIGLIIWLFESILTFSLLLVPSVFGRIVSFCESFWAKLPEWAKWILCWPFILILFFLSAVTTVFISHSILTIMPDQFSELFSPTLGAFFVTPILFLLIFLLVPRKQSLVAGIFIFLNTVYGIFYFLNLYLINNDDKWVNLRSGEDYQMPHILVVAASVLLFWYWFFYFKKNFKQPKPGSPTVELINP